MRCGVRIGGAVLAAVVFLFGAFGETQAYFEATEVGARALSMGRAFVPIADDLSAIYWNPAGLSLLERPEIQLTHYRPFLVPDLDLNFASFALPTAQGTFWAAWSHLSAKGVLDEDLVYVGASRAMELRGRRLSLGGNVKMYRVGYDGPAITNDGFLALEAETKIGLDLGLHARISPKVDLGYVVRNVGNPSFDFVSGGGKSVLDTVHEAGVGYQWHAESRLAVVFLEGSSSSYTVVAGSETSFFDVFALRIGLGDLQYFGGVGVETERMRVDTAFSTHNSLGISTMVSVTFRLGSTL